MSARESVRWGIDLGTTNSALAILLGDRVRVVKNSLQEEITPSAAAFFTDPDGRVDAVVGKRARQKLRGMGADRVAIEFKRYMGVPDWRFRVSALGVEESAPELSGRVLRDLKSSVALRGDLPVMHAAIVTVPAAFSDTAKDDTADAAELAGLGWADTLPEPVAAALAYGRRADTAHAPIWLAYDLGGGTFDAALVRGEDGVFTILDHAGDRNLGGKDLDEAIVRELILPRLSGEIRERAENVDSLEWRILKYAAEQAKCLLSVDERAPIDHDIEGIPDIWLDKADLTAIQSRVFGPTLALCHDLLARNGFGPHNIEKVILVGGPTLSPSLRHLIERGIEHNGSSRIEGLGIAIDCSVNPLTAVAEGAAVYAAGVRVPENGLRDVTETVAPGTVFVTVEAPAQVGEPSALAAGQLREGGTELTIQPSWAVIIERVDDADVVQWETDPPLSLSGQAAFHAQLPLDEGQNRFRVRVLDESRNPVPTPPTTFEILRDVGIGGVLTRTTGIGVADKRGVTRWLVRKGEPRAETVTRDFETAVALERGKSGTAISIPIVEGEEEKASLNHLIADLRIKSDHVPCTIPAGSPLTVTIAFGGRRTQASAVLDDFPEVRIEGSLNPHGQLPDATREMLEEAERNMELFEEVRSESPEIDAVLTKIEEEGLVEEIEGLLDIGTENSPDAWSKAGDRVLVLLQMLDPHYEDVDELHQWMAERALCDENVRKAKEIVNEVSGLPQDWLARFYELTAEYDRACEARDIVRAHEIAFGEIPAHYQTSSILEERVGGGLQEVAVGQRVERGTGRRGGVQVKKV